MDKSIMDDIRAKLTETILLVLIIIFIPISLVSIYRMTTTGFQPIQVAVPILFGVIVVIYFMRQHLSLKIRIFAILLMLYLDALFAFYSYGLLSMGFSVMLTLVALVVLLAKRRTIHLVIILSILTSLIFMFLISSEVISMDKIPATYSSDISSWASQIVSFVGICGILYFTIHYTRYRLEEAIDINHRLHKSREEALEQEVAERTQDLETTLKELMQKEKLASLGSLVAGVAHEINTPLGVSITASSFLTEQTRQFKKKMDEGLKKSELTEYLNAVEETSGILDDTLQRAAELVNSFKKVSVSHAAGYTTLFNLTEYIHSVILTLKHEYKNTGHQIIFDESEAYWMSSDPSLFSQIFTNLIMNALIHGLKDRTDGIIEIQLIRIPEGLEIRFRDNGNGIPEEHLNTIFDPFFTTNRHGGGSGLGLSIVYNIITEVMKGKLACDSSLGQGTLFIMRLPIQTYRHSDEFSKKGQP